MEEIGFNNVTTDDIAERAGASKATIYRWWQNKACLLAEALRVAVGHEQPFPQTGDFEKDIRQQLRNFATLLNSTRGRSFRAFLSAAQSDPEAAIAFRTGWVEPRRMEARRVLEEYQQNGGLPVDQDLDIVLDAMYGPFYVHLTIGADRISLAYADSLAQVILNGIRAGIPHDLRAVNCVS